MNVQIVEITPERAKQYLEKNTRNRTLRESKVAAYSRDMKNGDWMFTHQGIAFNCDGTLLDGQHRLAAIVDSGKTQRMLVTTGIQTDSQLVMDGHAKRTPGDAIGLARGEKITSTFVAIVRVCVEIPKSFKMTNVEIDHKIDEFRDAIDFAMSKFPTKERGVSNATILAAVAMAWFYVDNLERLSHFCDVLRGRELPDGDQDRSAVTLREFLLRTHIKSGTDRRDVFKKAQRVIQAFMNGVALKKLYTPEGYEFPYPLENPKRASTPLLELV